jgi:hypothetical protein
MTSRKVRPDVLVGETYKLKTEAGNFYLTINSLEGVPIEVRIQVGKSGTVMRNSLEVLGICLSRILQTTGKEAMLDFLLDNFKEIRGEDNLIYDGKQYKSVMDFVAFQLTSKLNSLVEVSTEIKVPDHDGHPRVGL